MLYQYNSLHEYQDDSYGLSLGRQYVNHIEMSVNKIISLKNVRSMQVSEQNGILIMHWTPVTCTDTLVQATLVRYTKHLNLLHWIMQYIVPNLLNYNLVKWAQDLVLDSIGFNHLHLLVLACVVATIKL